jgi:hypothetical protein
MGNENSWGSLGAEG